MNPMKYTLESSKGVDKLCIADLTLSMIKGSFLIVAKVFEVIVSI